MPLLILASNAAALAQGRVPVVHDAEIEALVRDYARPIFKAAGLSRSGIDIVLVNDPRFNAFVAGRRIFINTGALLTAETPNEIIGVIAHEAGHMAGGHQERLRQQLARAQTMAVIGTLLGMGAAAAGAATDSGGLGKAGAGIAAGTSEIARRGRVRDEAGRGEGHRLDHPLGDLDAERRLGRGGVGPEHQGRGHADEEIAAEPVYHDTIPSGLKTTSMLRHWPYFSRGSS